MFNNLKKYTWSIVFFLFSILEYLFQTFDICGSSLITGKMWFMYFCMGLASIPIKKE